MFICLKCRTFYSGDPSRFCLKDGLPLTRVDQTGDLWREGTEAIRETQSVIKRQSRLQKLKRMVSVSVTTVLVIMVVSVMVINSYVYLNPEMEMPLPSSPMAVLLPPKEPEVPAVKKEAPLPVPDTPIEETPFRLPDKAPVPEVPKTVPPPVITRAPLLPETPVLTPETESLPVDIPLRPLQAIPVPVPQVTTTTKKKKKTKWTITFGIGIPIRPSTPKRTPVPQEPSQNPPYNPQGKPQ